MLIKSTVLRISGSLVLFTPHDNGNINPIIINRAKKVVYAPLKKNQVNLPINHNIDNRHIINSN